jgi:Tfp pilus assembly protein PilN
MSKAILVPPQINLLPLSYRQKQERARLVAPSVLVILLAFAAVGATWYIASFEAKTVAAKAQDLQDAANAPKTTSTSQTTSTVNIADGTSRITQLNSMAKGEIDWNAALDMAGRLIPKDVRLTTYTYGAGTTGASLRLGGVAPSNVSFAVFIQSLQSNTKLTSVKVDSYSYSSTDGSVTFTVSIQFPTTLIVYPSPSPSPRT